MLWLPGPVGPNATWRLPLADYSAAGLLSVLGGSDDRHSAALLRETLEHDPALTLWVVRSATAAGSDGLRSIEALAHWLALNCHCRLNWPDETELTPDDEAWRERYRRLSAFSIAAARGARELAAHQPAVAEQAFLLGLLHAAEQWPSLDCGYTPETPTNSRLVLPSWLTSELGRWHERPTADVAGPAWYAAQARQALDENAALADYERLTASGPLASAALVELARRLPTLIKELAAARHSPADFDARVEAAKLAAMGEFAAGAGHEINNPIAVIAGRAQLLLQGEKHAQRRHELAVINTQAMRVYEMIADMMLFARPPAPKWAPCDMSAVARQVVAEIMPLADERAIVIDLELPDAPLVIDADPSQLSVVLRALCDNALAAVGRGGHILVRLGDGPSREAAAKAQVTLTVTDDGPGITDEVRRHVFDPFYSGRQAGRGLGMGLAKAWRIVRNHHGRIEVKSEWGRGSTFTVVLPANGF